MSQPFYIILLEIQFVENYGSVCGSNRENTARVVGLVVPVTRSDLNRYLLTCESLEEGVLACAGAVESEAYAVARKEDVSVVLTLLNGYGSLNYVNLVGVLLVLVEIVDELNILVGDKVKGILIYEQSQPRKSFVCVPR